MLSRRDTLVLAAGAAGASLLGGRAAFAQNVAPAELAQPGPLGDVWLGPDTAKVTIVETQLVRMGDLLKSGQLDAVTPIEPIR